MKGMAVPKGWQGGLPYTYRVEGGASLKVRLKVEQKKGLCSRYQCSRNVKGQRGTRRMDHSRKSL